MEASFHQEIKKVTAMFNLTIIFFFSLLAVFGNQRMNLEKSE